MDSELSLGLLWRGSRDDGHGTDLDEKGRRGEPGVLRNSDLGRLRAPQLEPDGSVVVGEVTATAALSSLARDAIDLFRGPLGHRIRVCAADDCGFLFVDASRPGQRRWCSMQGCDNLAKVRRHRAGAPKETS